MTATGQSFADFVAERDNVADMEKQIENYCLMLCEALIQDYIDYSIKSHNRSIYLADAGDVRSVRYHEACIEELKNGQCDYDFTVESGRKYHKIIMDANGSRSVHAFIDKKTGEVYKPASFKSPAKHVRFNLLMENSREFLFENCDWAGSYLYMN